MTLIFLSGILKCEEDQMRNDLNAENERSLFYELNFFPQVLFVYIFCLFLSLPFIVIVFWFFKAHLTFYSCWLLNVSILLTLTFTVYFYNTFCFFLFSVCDTNCVCQMPYNVIVLFVKYFNTGNRSLE